MKKSLFALFALVAVGVVALLIADAMRVAEAVPSSAPKAAIQQASRLEFSTSNIDPDLAHVYAAKAAGTLDPNDPAYLRLLQRAASEFDGRGGHSLDQGSDTCAATVIGAIPYFDSGTTAGRVDNFSGSCVGAGAPDVIYQFTPSITQVYTISLCGSSYDTGLYVKTGGACPGTTEVVCDDDACGLASQVTPALTAGTTYWIIVDGYTGQSGAYVLNITGPPAPCTVTCPPGGIPEGEACPAGTDHFNSGCNNSPPVFSPISCGQTVCGQCNTVGGFRDLDWYSFIMPSASTITWTVRASFNVSGFIMLGGCPPTVIVANSALACSTLVLSAAMMPPATYYVMVAPADWNTLPCGNYVATLSCGVPGDNCASVIQIDSLPYSTTGTTVGASDDFHANGNTSPDVIYSFVAPDSGSYLISLCGSSYNTLLEVRTGGACPGTTQVALNDDGCFEEMGGDTLPQSQALVSLTAGIRYFVIVDGPGANNAGSFELQVNSFPPPRPAASDTSVSIQNATCIAIDCSGNMYFLHCPYDGYLHKWTSYASNGPLSSVQTHDGTGRLINLNQEISWDPDHCCLWGATGRPNSQHGDSIWTIDPATGLCSFRFPVQDPSWTGGQAADGLAYDPDGTLGGTLWLSWDKCPWVWKVSNAFTIPQTPVQYVFASNTNDDSISGICATPQGLWAAHRLNGDIELFSKIPVGIRLLSLARVIQTNMGIECLESECNPAGHPGQHFLWVQDATNCNPTYYAYVLGPDSCYCACSCDSGRCCYCNDRHQRSCSMRSLLDCEAIGGQWDSTKTCQDPCSSYADVRATIDGPPLFPTFACVNGVITPTNFTLSAFVYNYRTTQCDSVTAEIIGSTGSGGTVGFTGPTINHIGSLGPHSLGVGATFSAHFTSINPLGGTICFMIRTNSTCCGPDTIHFCIQIPPCACPCPYANVDSIWEPSNGQCSDQTIGESPIACGDTVCGNISTSADTDYYAIFVPATVPPCSTGSGVRLRISVFGNGTPGYCPYLRGLDPEVALLMSCANQTAYDSGSGIAGDPYLSPCIPGGGRYHIRVTGQHGTHGPYILAVTCQCCTCATQCTDVCDAALAGLQNWWPLDDAAVQPGGSSCDMISFASATWSSNPLPAPGRTDSGKVGAAYCFNGTSYMHANPSSNVSVGAGSFTLDCWFRADNNNTSMRTIAGKDNGVNGYQLYLNNGVLTARVVAGTSSVMTAVASSAVPVGQWIWAAMTFTNNSPANDVLTLYWGTPCLATGVAGSPQLPLGNLNNSAFFGIASSQAPGFQNFIGCIDEVELWTRALSGTELQNICLAGSTGKCKERCHIWGETEAPGSVIYYLRLCNYGLIPTQFTIQQAVGLCPSFPDCPYVGPTAFNFGAGSLTTGNLGGPCPISTHCQTFSFGVTLPPGIPYNTASCFKINILNVVTGVPFCCEGSAWRTRIIWHLPSGGGPLFVPMAHDSVFSFMVHNTEDSTGVIRYTLAENPPDPQNPTLRLNGLPPGVPYTGTLVLALGDSAVVNVTMRLTELYAGPAVTELRIGLPHSGTDSTVVYPWDIEVQSSEDLTSPPSPLVTIILDVSGNIRLDWGYVENATGYNVFESDVSPTGPWTSLGTTALNSFMDTSAPQGSARRYYYVTAHN